MHTKTLVTTLSLLLAAASPGTCLAGATDDLQLNRIEPGVGWLTDDAYRFGRYTGLTDEGAYLVGDIKARDYSEDGDYWRVRGTNLGLDSRYLRLEGGTLGQQQYFLEYDQLPNNWADSANTPFLGVGKEVLTLPQDFDIQGCPGRQALQRFIEHRPRSYQEHARCGDPYQSECRITCVAPFLVEHPYRIATA